MAPSDHAKLSPSGSAKWMTCPASIRAEAEFRELHPDRVRGDTIHSIRGTQAHAVAEAFVLGEEAIRPDDEGLTDDEWDEMCYHAEGFKQYVDSLVNEGDLLLVEKRLKMDKVSKGMYGTGDITILDKQARHLHIVDLKYGRGEVEAKENTQLQLYAIGADAMIREMGLPPPKKFTVHIYQPRTPGGAADSWSFEADQLLRFELRARDGALATEDPDAKFVPSEKGCQWCDAAPTCKAFAEHSITKAFDLLDLLDDINPVRVGMACDELKGRKPLLMTNDELCALRELFPASKKWMEAVERYLTEEARAGNIDSLKLVEGRGSNVCIDPEAVEFMIGPIAYKDPQVKSVTELKKVVGAKNFDNVLGDYFEKRPGKPTLVSLDDDRPALKTDADLLSMLDD